MVAPGTAMPERKAAEHGSALQVSSRRAWPGAADERYSTPRRIWSRSMLSNSAVKLPSPKPSLPLRWMISKKIGPMQFWVKICSSLRWWVAGAAAVRIWV